MTLEPSFILPDWPAPACIRSLVTTRVGGVSEGPYAGFNLGKHVEDTPVKVESNRTALYQHIGHRVEWLSQIHGNKIQTLNGHHLDQSPEADAAYTSVPNVVCAVMTADCLPILLCDQSGRHVAAVHAGWRSLAQGIVSKALAKFPCPKQEVLAYLGPAISQAAFEVGADVLQAFRNAAQERNFAEKADLSFRASAEHEGKYFADIYRLARAELQGVGVEHIYGGNYCTFTESRFFSYRRDGVTGRMASLIWIDSE